MKVGSGARYMKEIALVLCSVLVDDIIQQFIMYFRLLQEKSIVPNTQKY